MEVFEAIRSRRSIRRYKQGADIPRRDVETLLEAAMMAPSAVNSRPWEFYATDREEIKRALMQAHPACKMLETASWAIVVCGRPDLQPTAFGRRTAARRSRTCCSPRAQWGTGPAGAAVTPASRARKT